MQELVQLPVFRGIGGVVIWGIGVLGSLAWFRRLAPPPSSCWYSGFWWDNSPILVRG